MHSKESKDLVLELFFSNLANFNFDKAKEVIEKDKDSSRFLSAIWMPVSQLLCQLALSEKLYYSFSFLSPKGFLRKESTLKKTYESLRDDFRRFDGLQGEESFLSHLSGQLSHFSSARIEVLDFYERLAVVASSKNGNLEDLLPVISDVCEGNASKFYHPILSQVKTIFSIETDCLQKLLKAHLDIQHWHFFVSVISLQEAKVKLEEWNRLLQGKETRKVLFMKTQQHCPNYQWLERWKTGLVAKFSLYFYQILSQQTSAGEMRALCGKHPVDFVYMIQSFQKKHEASCISLMLDATDLKEYQGGGYHLPARKRDDLAGPQSFPFIFCYPNKPDAAQTSTLISNMNNVKTPGTLNHDRIVPLTENRNSFFVLRVDPRVSLVVIFHDRKSEIDSHVSSFMFDLTSQLRCSKIFASLRTTVK